MKHLRKLTHLLLALALVMALIPATTQPADKAVKAGDTAKFTVKAAGVDLTYRWQYKAPDGTWKNSGATGHNTATLSISATAARSGYQYRCVIVDGRGNKVISSAATLTVK